MSEKRREQRFPARIVARINRRGEAVDLLTNDVSFRGAFLRTDAPPALRQLVRVAFTLPDGATASANAMVVHVVEPNAEGRVPGVGLQFWGPISEGKSWEQFVYDLKVRERAGVPSARATDKVRRTSERFKLALDIEVGGRHTTTRDVSWNGMAIRTDVPMPVGVRVGVKLHTGAAVLNVDVVVRRKIDEPAFRGLGVEFVDLDDDAREGLVRLLQAETISEEDVVYVDPDDPQLH